MNQVKPFSPAEARAAVVNTIPVAVLTAVNDLLSKNFDDHSITIKQKDVIDRAKKLMYPGLHADDREVQSFDIKWLNFEAAYELNGWNVTYDKPGYNESYDATFTFTPKRG